MTRLTFPDHALHTDWKRAHNAAFTTPSSDERRIVAQTTALQVTIDTLANEHLRVDPHAAQSIIGPMTDALLATLNYERGRIDGGRVCEWVAHVTREAGWDYETDTYITN